MTQFDWIAVAVAAVLTVLAGLMTAGETALYQFSKGRAQELVDQGVGGAKRVLLITEDPPPYLNTSLFVRVLLQASTAVLVALVVFDNIGELWLRLLLVIGIMVLVDYIGWGVAPRTLGRQHATKVAVAYSAPLSLLTTVLGPLPQLLILVGNALTPGRGYADGPFTSEAELRELVDRAVDTDVLEKPEGQMIRSVFDLGTTIVKEVMVPRTDVVFIEHDKTLRQGLSLMLRSGFSRIPVIGDDGLDDVQGVLFFKDLMKRVYDNADSQKSERVASVMRPAAFCPDSKPVAELMQEMQANRSHMVIVIDEFGGVAGLATIEDILEEIVGEIVDEFDEEELAPSEELGPERYRVSARLSVSDLGELFGLDLDDEDVDSVGGLMAKELNKVPIPGSEVVVHGLELTAERGTGRRNRIRTIMVTRADIGEPGVDAATELAAESAERRT
ncbi:hemolysin family protein [Granulicoccus phenolivorans]|uniref:hemolysin family protein n=1 Tax=Granulicoccus phenolivorans TaxID=266854 RepID=UPI00040284D4|nr:hemolysin family protein [Granulicoccus phenolivorans]